MAGVLKSLALLAAMPLLMAASPWSPDQGDGTYRNPVLAGDYSDPDVIRVGDDFYLTASSFTNVPGLPILHSRDLVNWEIIGHALAVVPPEAHYSTPRHGGGVWAPAIRYRNGKFLIYYPDPDRGVFLTTATNPAGPWSAPALVDASKGVIDPAPFWDDDGTGWLAMAWAKSRAGFNNVITLKRLNADGTRTVGEGIPIIEGDKLPSVRTSRGPMPWMTTEGPKLYKRDGWYYLFAPSGSVKAGWQGVFRSRSITGPYEGRDVLDQGRSAVNGPHQGAWVTTAQGQDWFVHFQDTDSYGRRVWLEPMVWRKGWPVIGADPDGDGIGEPVLAWKKPVAGAGPATPATEDSFEGSLSPAWQWNANSSEDWASLTAAPGWLRLKSVSSPVNLWEASAVLTQKLPAERFSATVRLRFAPEAVGERAGLVIYGADYAWIGVEKAAEGLRLVRVDRPRAAASQPETVAVALAEAPPEVVLRISAEPVTVPEPPPGFSPYFPAMLRSVHARVRFSYSLDGRRFTALGAPFVSRPGRWVGAQIGLFAQAPSGTPAYVATSVGGADFDDFRIGPADRDTQAPTAEVARP
ncbi:glycoside hydrolase 43 family protein [Phenylobacterium sp. LjRoot225]|uniref:glycoside hydrolase family 43 protein n=1 Tax=Phenylobacterium sp. LjRoot225 TaxID=3342285 RepID=UPI003ED0FCD5